MRFEVKSDVKSHLLNLSFLKAGLGTGASEEVFTTLKYKGNKLITSLLIRLPFFNSLVLS